ncbi:hypothetical protein [Gluconobacter sphaericus]|uniref:hypothetical protein n=1 Tax=Gluconobacter sphaericus TaxID=574987 RepID=UPI001B8D9284|nr:hypothetical protein [Gluconobacter sphaericus]MBS1086415.1 hypothetical protein [Gluconobacter sphaericus]MBS1100621.1 hypothetical protein [Gluconobacter sphaericus]
MTQNACALGIFFNPLTALGHRDDILQGNVSSRWPALGAQLTTVTVSVARDPVLQIVKAGRNLFLH